MPILMPVQQHQCCVLQDRRFLQQLQGSVLVYALLLYANSGLADPSFMSFRACLLAVLPGCRPLP
jgi:hypothetical protein